MKINSAVRSQALSDLCETVRGLASCGEYDRCCELICSAMGAYPDAPQPHNLLGVVLEKAGDHAGAMKHFRAAWALDPTYCPASQNLTIYGTFSASHKIAYDECDCGREEETPYRIEYDTRGVGHVVRRN